MIQNTGFIRSEDIAEECNWNAAIFVGAPAVVRKISAGGVHVGEIGSCIEGWRGVGKENINPQQSCEIIPVFRQPDLAPMRFQPGEEHWQAPQIQGLWCIQAGDVVINRTLPFRAAWATSALHHHPVDSNCIIIRFRKSDRISGFWTALCLNQQVYTSYLAALSGGLVLTRVNMGMLSDLKLPPVPEWAATLSTEVWDWNNAMLENSATLARLKAEVEDYVLKDISQLSVKVGQENGAYLKQGERFSADDVEDSLIPWHVELSHFQKELKRNLYWIRLADLLSDESLSRGRLSAVPDGAPFIRLSDLDADLAIDWTKSDGKESVASRVYKEPLTSGEVLVSTLVSNSRVAYSGEVPRAKVYVTDHLERLRFRETPGAWAILLQTSVAREQLKRSAIGTALQFASRASIQQLRLPPVPREIRLHWEQALARHHQLKSELEAQWRVLWPRAQALFDKLLDGPVPVRGGRRII